MSIDRSGQAQRKKIGEQTTRSGQDWKGREVKDKNIICDNPANQQEDNQYHWRLDLHKAIDQSLSKANDYIPKASSQRSQQHLSRRPANNNTMRDDSKQTSQQNSSHSRNHSHLQTPKGYEKADNRKHVHIANESKQLPGENLVPDLIWDTQIRYKMKESVFLEKHPEVIEEERRRIELRAMQKQFNQSVAAGNISTQVSVAPKSLKAFQPSEASRKNLQKVGQLIWNGKNNQQRQIYAIKTGENRLKSSSVTSPSKVQKNTSLSLEDIQNMKKSIEMQHATHLKQVEADKQSLKKAQGILWDEKKNNRSYNMEDYRKKSTDEGRQDRKNKGIKARSEAKNQSKVLIDEQKGNKPQNSHLAETVVWGDKKKPKNIDYDAYRKQPVKNQQPILAKTPRYANPKQTEDYIQVQNKHKKTISEHKLWNINKKKPINYEQYRSDVPFQQLTPKKHVEPKNSVQQPSQDSRKSADAKVDQQALWGKKGKQIDYNAYKRKTVPQDEKRLKTEAKAQPRLQQPRARNEIVPQHTLWGEKKTSKQTDYDSYRKKHVLTQQRQSEPSSHSKSATREQVRLKQIAQQKQLQSKVDKASVQKILWGTPKKEIDINQYTRKKQANVVERQSYGQIRESKAIQEQPFLNSSQNARQPIDETLLWKKKPTKTNVDYEFYRVKSGQKQQEQSIHKSEQHVGASNHSKQHLFEGKNQRESKNSQKPVDSRLLWKEQSGDKSAAIARQYNERAQRNRAEVKDRNAKLAQQTKKNMQSKTLQHKVQYSQDKKKGFQKPINEMLWSNKKESKSRHFQQASQQIRTEQSQQLMFSQRTAPYTPSLNRNFRSGSMKEKQETSTDLPDDLQSPGKSVDMAQKKRGSKLKSSQSEQTLLQPQKIKNSKSPKNLRLPTQSFFAGLVSQQLKEKPKSNLIIFVLSRISKERLMDVFVGLKESILLKSKKEIVGKIVLKRVKDVWKEGERFWMEEAFRKLKLGLLEEKIQVIKKESKQSKEMQKKRKEFLGLAMVGILRKSLRDSFQKFKKPQQRQNFMKRALSNLESLFRRKNKQIFQQFQERIRFFQDQKLTKLQRFFQIAKKSRSSLKHKVFEQLLCWNLRFQEKKENVPLSSSRDIRKSQSTQKSTKNPVLQTELRSKVTSRNNITADMVQKLRKEMNQKRQRFGLEKHKTEQQALQLKASNKQSLKNSQAQTVKNECLKKKLTQTQSLVRVKTKVYEDLKQSEGKLTELAKIYCLVSKKDVKKIHVGHFVEECNLTETLEKEKKDILREIEVFAENCYLRSQVNRIQGNEFQQQVKTELKRQRQDLQHKIQGYVTETYLWEEIKSRIKFIH